MLDIFALSSVLNICTILSWRTKRHQRTNWKRITRILQVLLLGEERTRTSSILLASIVATTPTLIYTPTITRATSNWNFSFMITF